MADQGQNNNSQGQDNSKAGKTAADVAHVHESSSCYKLSVGAGTGGSNHKVSNRKKVNRLVTYIKSTGRRRPAVVTAIAANSGVVLRVRHTGEVYGNGTTGILLRTSNAQTNVFVTS